MQAAACTAAQTRKSFPLPGKGPAECATLPGEHSSQSLQLQLQLQLQFKAPGAQLRSLALALVLGLTDPCQRWHWSWRFEHVELCLKYNSNHCQCWLPRSLTLWTAAAPSLPLALGLTDL